MRLLKRASGMDQDEYQKAIDEGLDRAFREAVHRDAQLHELRVVIFSDLHRGARDGADDFQRCEAAYSAALGWYLEQGHELWLLGDVEELWENDLDEVLPAYRALLRMERAFQEGAGLQRFYGNHDLDWSDPRRLKRLQESLPGVRVQEAMRLRVLEGTEVLGLIFLAHGHQGTDVSDRGAGFSRLVLRYVWRYIQRAQGLLSTTPADDHRLRHRHDTAMFRWARSRVLEAPPGERPVLVAGHTHHPVFPGEGVPRPDTSVAARLEEELRAARESGAGQARLSELRAELERVRALGRLEPYDPPPIDPPCYFNTGCCSFPDRDVTGLEIIGGQIRLVRWLDDGGEARPKVLAEESLRKVLDSVAAA